MWKSTFLSVLLKFDPTSEYFLTGFFKSTKRVRVFSKLHECVFSVYCHGFSCRFLPRANLPSGKSKVFGWDLLWERRNMSCRATSEGPETGEPLLAKANDIEWHFQFSVCVKFFPNDPAGQKAAVELQLMRLKPPKVTSNATIRTFLSAHPPTELKIHRGFVRSKTRIHEFKAVWRKEQRESDWWRDVLLTAEKGGKMWMLSAAGSSSKTNDSFFWVGNVCFVLSILNCAAWRLREGWVKEKNHTGNEKPVCHRGLILEMFACM